MLQPPLYHLLHFVNSVVYTIKSVTLFQYVSRILTFSNYFLKTKVLKYEGTDVNGFSLLVLLIVFNNVICSVTFQKRDGIVSISQTYLTTHCLPYPIATESNPSRLLGFSFTTALALCPVTF